MIPVISGVIIQTGVSMISAGLKRVVPEIAKLLDDPEIESVVKDLRLDKTLTRTLINITKK